MPEPASKSTLTRLLIAKLRGDLASLERSQADSEQAATHEENRAEHAKDTRATEQSYLARGLAERVEDLRRSERILSNLEMGHFDHAEPIAVTAIVRFVDEETRAEQEGWLLPVAGGIELDGGGGSIRTITTTSPLGRALVGLGPGDTAEVKTPRGLRELTILSVR